MAESQASLINQFIRIFLENKFLTLLLVLALIGMGVYFMPFDHGVAWLPSDPVPVDAIPDIGENQQIVFTEWPGRSPQDIEDQITYPLSVSLQGIPGVKSIRSYSTFGFSTIYIIFKEGVDFYWSRSRVLERFSQTRQGLPQGVTPLLGPDATALGQIFWYTLEGEGFSLMELRSIQDWYVRYALATTEGVSEVASIGGYVKEYQIDVDPHAMRAQGVSLQEVFSAARRANIDVGAKTIESNGVEYVIRGLGFIKSVQELENVVVKSRANVPIYIKNVATVRLGPAMRRGALDKEGAEVVGGVVVARYGANPLQVIARLKRKIALLSPGLSAKRLPDGRRSQVRIVPFYDRSGLIKETLGTLQQALSQEIMVTVVVIVIFLMNFRSSLLVSTTLPLAVLLAFALMHFCKVDSNIMSLSGIAIAIGTMVDMGIIMSENILKHLEAVPPQERNSRVVLQAASEVGGAVLTAILTTVVSFLPVFAMQGPEGKLFKPLAYTKTFALLASVLVALTVVPTGCHLLFGSWLHRWQERTGRVHKLLRWVARLALGGLAISLGLVLPGWSCLALYVGVAILMIRSFVSAAAQKRWAMLFNVLLVALALYYLTRAIMPLGRNVAFGKNLVVVSGGILGLILFFLGVCRCYPVVIRLVLRVKLLVIMTALGLLAWALTIWLGFDYCWDWLVPCLALPGMPVLIAFGLLGLLTWQATALMPPLPSRKRLVVCLGAPLLLLISVLAISGWYPWQSMTVADIRASKLWGWSRQHFPGLGEEFMPPLDEGAFLYMPTTMPHASIGEVLDVLQKQDMRIKQIPEVESVVGKLGRVSSPLDPAPISMIETIITYKPEYSLDPISGKLKRQWREHIKSPEDIWQAILQAAQFPGTTFAPKLQPISARIVMLQSGMRAPMGIKLKRTGSGDLKLILQEMEEVGLAFEKYLKQVPGVAAAAVVADRIVGKPYLEFAIDRQRIARYGVNIREVQDVIEIAIGGRRATTTVEGRERYAIRVRYARELRDNLVALQNILVSTNNEAQIPLTLLGKFRFVRGPQVIKSEDGFLVGYILFDKKAEYAEVDVVQAAQRYLRQKIKAGELDLPAGLTYEFAGSYQNQVRSEQRLRLLVPLCLVIIFIILYCNFKSLLATSIVFAAIPVALSGGFILLWLYGQPWFLNWEVFGVGLRDMFHVRPYNLSVAVWVGFIALIGIASDDAVVTLSYITQQCAQVKLESIEHIRTQIARAGAARIRPCMMTTATTILALLPVLLSSGRGADVMIPMALPSVGGMLLEIFTLFITPVIYCCALELHFHLQVIAKQA